MRPKLGTSAGSARSSLYKPLVEFGLFAVQTRFHEIFQFELKLDCFNRYPNRANIPAKVLAIIASRLQMP